MLKTEKTAVLFDKARAIYDEAIQLADKAHEYWDRDLLRMSAEKTWAAALMATNAFILARTGVEPEPDDGDGAEKRLLELYKEIPDWERFTGHFAVISEDIYKAVVVERNVEPAYLLIHDIREAADYIRECERLAGLGGG